MKQGINAVRLALAALGWAATCAWAGLGPPVAVWTGPNLGSWHEASNWAGGVPGSTTQAYIDEGVAVLAGSSAGVAELTVGGSATGRPAGLGVATGLSADRMVIGKLAGSEGIVTIGRSGRLLVAYGGLQVGVAGRGQLIVDTTTNLYSLGQIEIGMLPGGDGTLELRSGTFYNQGPGIDVASRGRGALSVLGGAKLYGIGTMVELAQAGGTAQMRVAGPGSLANVEGIAGHAGATVSVERSGRIEAVFIAAGDSSWSVGSGGSVTAFSRLGLADGTRLTFTLSDHAAAGAGRIFGSHFALDGTLSVTLAEGFDPIVGDSWQLLGWDQATGRFDRLDLPTLSGGLRWDDGALYATGTLRVAAVPEPGGAALLAAGLAGLCCMRRRRG